MKRKGKNESSPALIDIQNSLKALTECKEQEKRTQLLMEFTIHFEEFLIDTENQKLINKHASTFTNQMMSYSYLALNSIPLLLSILRILFKVHSISTITIHPKEAVPLFIALFTVSNSFSNAIIECSSVIEYFFKDESFFTLFLSQNGIYILFQTAFFQDSSTKQFSQYINLLLFKKTPISNYQTFHFEEFFLDILNIKQKSISDKIISEYLYFISHLFYIMTHFIRNSSKFFIDKGIFAMYDNLVGRDLTSQHLQNYKIFISSNNDDLSGPPNSQFVLQIFNKYQNSTYLSSEQNDYFQLILAFIVADSKSATKINETTPFINYFNTGNPPIQHLVSLFAGINSVKPDLIPSCIPPLFLKLITHEAGTSNYQIIVNILDSQLKNKLITSEFLYESGFATVFYSDCPKESLFEILNKNPSFQNMTIDIFKIPAAVSYQPMIFKRILDLFDLYEEDEIKSFAKIVEVFLMISPSEPIMTHLINKITDVRSTELFNLLLKVFGVNKEASENFVNANGINWVFEIYNEHLIKVKQIANILAKLVTFQAIPELDLAVRKLPHDHQLFQLPPSFLLNIVYGENPRFPIIRTSSAIPFIPPIENLDPYNAWILGCRFSDQYRDNIYEMPMLNTIMNRYIKPELISELLKRPERLNDFVDMKYDHFPLFQFYPMDTNSSDNPGNIHLVFQKSFLGISFWFKFSEEVKNQEILFRTNNLSLVVTNKKSLVINCENILKEVPIDQTDWCHIFIKLKLSLMARMITLYVNSNSYHFVTKLQTFSFARFSHINEGIMFLGSTIRFYNIVTIKQDSIDFKILYKKGPGYMRSFLSKEEQIFTPSRIKLNCNSIVTIPENCFSVPYFGFSMHFASIKNLEKLIKILENSENDEIYDSLFRLILKIRRIDQYKNQFFTRIISSMKKNNKYLKKDHFVSLLETVKAKSSHIPLILYDRDLWKYISNDIIIESLFEYFTTGINWQSFENIELFLSTVVCENQSSKTIINVLLNNHSRLPKFMKFLISILKIAPTMRQANCSWESVEFREETEIQFTILDCLCSFVQPSTIELVTPLLPYEDLRSLMIVSPASISAKVFHLIAVIEKYHSSYIPPNDGLLITAVSFLSSYESVWNDILEMKPINYPLHLVLIWAGGLCMIHQNTYDIESTPHTEKLENLLKTCIEKLSSNTTLTQILSNELCLSMIMSWFPFVLHYNVLFQAFPEDDIAINKPFESLTISQFPEVTEPIWIGTDQVLNETAFPLPPPAAKASQFMLEKVTSVLTSNHFQVPFPPLTSMKKVSQWFLQSLLLPFLTDLILLSPPQLLNKVLYAFFFEFVIGNPQHSDPLTPIFFQSMINRLSNFFNSSSTLSSQSQMTTSQILQFLHIFTGLQYLQDSSLIIISDLLTLAQLIQNKQGNSVMMKYTSSIEPIILSLFSSIRICDYQDVFSLFTNNIQMFATLITAEKSQLTWIYVFFIASHNERKLLNIFLNKLTPLLKLDQSSSILMNKLINRTIDRDMKSLSTIEEAWKQKSNDFQCKFKQYYTSIKDVKPAFPIEIGILSIDYKHSQFISNAKHFLVSRLFSNTMKYLSTSFLIKQEQNQWSRMTNELLENPKPMKKEHLSPFFFPYSLPRVLTPSPYPFININKDVNIRSVPIKLYKQNLLYSYSIVPDNKPSAIKMFIDLNPDLGQPSFVTNCTICRYDGEIPSVLFMFNEQMKIICNCQLCQNSDDIDFLKEIKTSLNHFFIESVLIGHWGVTEMFASRIVVTVKVKDLINIQKHKELSLIIYSFTVGNFILTLPRKDIQTKILKLKENIISNYSFYSIRSDQNSETINKKQRNRSKTLTISVPGTDSNQVYKIKPKARKGTLFPNFNWETDFNINETIQNFCSGKLSALETLLRINTVCGKSFLSLEKYPVAPKLNFDEIMREEEEKPNLTSLQPISYFQNSIKLDTGTKPLSYFGCVDFFEQSNVFKFFKLRESLESHSSKIIILNIIAMMFNIQLKNENIQSDIIERKNIGLVISELNSPLNFNISSNLSTSALSDSINLNKHVPLIKNEQIEEARVMIDHTDEEHTDEELIEMEHASEEINEIDRTDEEFIEEEEEDVEQSKQNKQETQNNEETKQNEEEVKKDEDKNQQNEQNTIEQEIKQNEEETRNNEETKQNKDEDKTLQNEQQTTEQETEQNEEEDKTEQNEEEDKTEQNEEEDKIEQNEQQTTEQETEQNEEDKVTKDEDKDQQNEQNTMELETKPDDEGAQQNEEETRQHEENKEQKEAHSAEEEPKEAEKPNDQEEDNNAFNSVHDLSKIIQSVESSDFSDLMNPLSIPDELVIHDADNSTTSSVTSTEAKSAPPQPTSFTPPISSQSVPMPNPASPRKIVPQSALSSISDDHPPKSMASIEKDPITSLNAKLKSKSVTNLPERALLFIPHKIYQMTGQMKVAFFSKVDRILPLPKLSEICLNHFIVSIESIEMKISSRKGKKVFASIVNPHFEYASSISVSKNGLFLVIDTFLSISETYQIHYRDGNPCCFELKNSMPFADGTPKSIVVGETWSVISQVDSLIVIWNFFRNFIYRTIDTKTIEHNNGCDCCRCHYLTRIDGDDDCLSCSYLDFKDDFLEAVSYDEGYDLIWYATKKGIYAVTSSGKLIGFYERKEMTAKITALKAVSLPIWQVDRIALIGDENGRIYFAYISYYEKSIDLKKLLKLHDCQITQFDVNQDYTIFLSTDIKGNIYTWKI